MTGRFNARAANAIGTEEGSEDYEKRTKLRGRALAAAYQAYQRARNAADEAAAYEAQYIRSQTGLGAEGASSH